MTPLSRTVVCGHLFLSFSSFFQIIPEIAFVNHFYDGLKSNLCQDFDKQDEE